MTSSNRILFISKLPSGELFLCCVLEYNVVFACFLWYNILMTLKRGFTMFDLKWMDILRIFAILVLFKAFCNFVYLISAKYYYKKYLSWSKKNNVNIIRYRHSIAKLFKRANVKEHNISRIRPLGYSQIQAVQISAIENIGVLDKELLIHTVTLFEESIGVFKSRMIESFNPLFWIELIIFLPRSIISYLGFKPESIFVRILQVLWWLITPVAIFFRDYINQFIIDTFNLS